MKLKKIAALFMVVMMVVGVSACGESKPKGETVATVGKQVITETELTDFMTLLSFAQGYEIDIAEIPEEKLASMMQMYLEEYINMQLIKQSFNDDEKVLPEEYKKQTESFLDSEATKEFIKKYKMKEETIKKFIRDQFFTVPLIENLKKEIPEPTDEQLKDYYDQNLEQFKEIKMSAQHILVEADKEELAKEIVAKLKKGEDFAALAKQHSTDPGTKDKGGDLGTFSSKNHSFDPVFAQAALALEQGQISDPVQTQFGWHIIKANTKENVEQTFEEAKETIKSILQQNSLLDAYTKKLDELREEIGVTYPESKESDADKETDKKDSKKPDKESDKKDSGK
jgi:foldase protein PrsA